MWPRVKDTGGGRKGSKLKSNLDGSGPGSSFAAVVYEVLSGGRNVEVRD